MAHPTVSIKNVESELYGTVHVQIHVVPSSACVHRHLPRPRYFARSPAQTFAPLPRPASHARVSDRAILARRIHQRHLHLVTTTSNRSGAPLPSISGCLTAMFQE